MSWVKEFLAETAASEAPAKYFYWSALAAISAVARRNVYLSRFLYTLYPNIYVIITGETGIRKGYPVSLARQLVEKVHCTKVMAGRGSIQGIVRELSRVQSVPGGEPIKDAVGFFCTGELSASLVKDPDTLVILIDLFDTHFNKDWKNTLKSVPIEKLTNIYLTILAASNETNLTTIVPRDTTGSGFIARTFFVHATEKRRVDSLMFKPEIIPNVDELAKHLYAISGLRGEFSMEHEVRIYFDEWYKNFERSGHKDATGTLERIHDGILKTAMLISLSDRLDLVITKEHVQEAEAACMDCFWGMKRVIIGSEGKAALAEQTELFLKELIRRSDHRVTRQKLLSKYWGCFDSIDLDRMAQTLLEAKAIEVHRSGRDTIYEMTTSALESYTKFAKEET